VGANDYLLSLPDGRDEHTPCRGVTGATLFCGEADLDDWWGREQEVFSLVRSAWNRLYESGGDYETARPTVELYEAGHETLESPSLTAVFGVGGSAARVDSYVASVRRGVAALDALDVGLAALGLPSSGTPAVTTPPPEGWWSGLSTAQRVGVVAGVGVVVVLLAARARSRR
jgi:hypothetical protein